MPGSALARGPISSILADSSGSREGSTLKLVTRTYMLALLSGLPFNRWPFASGCYYTPEAYIE